MNLEKLKFKIIEINHDVVHFVAIKDDDANKPLFGCCKEVGVAPHGAPHVIYLKGKISRRLKAGQTVAVSVLAAEVPGALKYGVLTMIEMPTRIPCTQIQLVTEREINADLCPRDSNSIEFYVHPEAAEGFERGQVVWLVIE